jgi:hypothetical protein
MWKNTPDKTLCRLERRESCEVRIITIDLKSFDQKQGTSQPKRYALPSALRTHHLSPRNETAEIDPAIAKASLMSLTASFRTVAFNADPMELDQAEIIRKIIKYLSVYK